MSNNNNNKKSQYFWQISICWRVCGPDLFFVSTAFWDATRAFMLLAVLSCFAGVVLGLSAFTNGTKNKRVRTGGIALLLSGNTHMELQGDLVVREIVLLNIHLIISLIVLFLGRVATRL